MKLTEVVRKVILDAEEWDQKYLEVTVHSLERYENGRDLEQTIRQFLSRKNRGEFKITNPYSKRLWLPELLHSFLTIMHNHDEAGLDDDYGDLRVACALITFTHKEWACADNNIQFNIGRAKQMVRNALIGTDFIGCFEAAVYKNEEWETGGVLGKLVCFHCHAIVWASCYSLLSRLRSRIKSRFEPILGNKSGVRLDALKTRKDLLQAVAYIAKMPAMGYRTVRKSNGKKAQEPSRITFKSRHHLFTALKAYDLFKFWLSGGDGVRAIRAARAKLKGYKTRDPIDRNEHRRKYLW